MTCTTAYGLKQIFFFFSFFWNVHVKRIWQASRVHCLCLWVWDNGWSIFLHYIELVTQKVTACPIKHSKTWTLSFVLIPSQLLFQFCSVSPPLLRFISSPSFLLSLAVRFMWVSVFLPSVYACKDRWFVSRKKTEHLQWNWFSVEKLMDHFVFLTGVGDCLCHMDKYTCTNTRTYEHTHIHTHT